MLGRHSSRGSTPAWAMAPASAAARGATVSDPGIALQPDGKLLVGGYISSVDGVTRNGIARLLGDAPQPTTGPTLSNPVKTGSTFSVSVPTVPGKTYVLQYTDNLGGNFLPIGTSIQGDGTTKTLTDNNASTIYRFYRVQVQ